MSKGSGSLRSTKPSSNSIAHNRGVFDFETSMPDVLMGESYFSESSGGFVLGMKGHNYDDIEREAFRHMADNGFLVVATPEGGMAYISGKSEKGKLL